MRSYVISFSELGLEIRWEVGKGCSDICKLGLSTQVSGWELMRPE